MIEKWRNFLSIKLNRIIIFSIILSLLIIIPAGFAAEVSAGLAEGNSLNEGILPDNSICDSELSNSLGNDDLNAVENNDMFSEDGTEGSDEPYEYYFDSNALDDNGNGSIDSPYKTVSDIRIKPNSILHFASGVYNYTPMNSTDKVNITIYGQDSSNTIINNPLDNQTFNVTKIFNVENITFNNLQIILKGNYTLLNASNVNFYNCTALKTDLSGTSCGGAIYSLDRNVTMILNECKFYNNFALYGGAIFTAFADLRITGCQFVNNTAGYYGGAIYQIYGNASISDSEFRSNKADDGGAVYIFSKNGFEISGNSFKNNVANSSAGAIYSFYNMNYTISNNVFENNYAQKYNDLYEKSDFIVLSGNYTLYRNSYSDGLNGAPSYDGENGTLPSYYNLFDYGFASSIKNQGQGGNCWSFAAMATLESAVIKSIYDMNSTGLIYNYSEYANILELLNDGQSLSDLIDFSEENMKNIAALYSPYGWNWDPNEGGNDELSIGYLISWLGPVYDEEDVYGDHSILSPVLISNMHVQNVLFLKRDNFTDNDAIKKAIMEYGAVSSSLGMNVRYNSNVGVYVYNKDDSSTNHEVSLVGWDDDVEIPDAPGKGAWIAKNSWGYWGNGGCFYISYYDASSPKIGKRDACIAIVLNDTIKYDKNYQYDISRTDYFFNETNTVWYKNAFTATDNEYLSAVSTYFEKETDWELSVYVNGILKSAKSGFSNPGYWTISLFEHVPLNAGDLFEIAFKIKVDGDVGVPISEYVSLNNEFYKAGISFISYDGKNWADLYDLEWMGYPHHTYNSQVACIKAFTVFDIINTTSSLNIDYDGHNPVNISLHVLNQYGNPVNAGKAIFNLSGQIISVNVSNGFANLTHTFDYGLNTIFANFVACGYSASSDYLSLDVSKVIVNVTADILFDLDTALVDISLSKPINETVYVFLENEKHTIQTVDGRASINLTDLKIGLNTIRIALDDALYASNEILENVTVKAKGTSIIISDLVTSYNSGQEYKIKLIDEDGNPLIGRELEYFLNNSNHTVGTDENGEISLNISLTTGLYDFDIRFKGEKLYINTSNSSLITVKTSIGLLENDYIYEGVYNVRLFDKRLNPLANQNVKIVLAGQAYKVKTDENGVAKVNIDLIPGTYNAIIKNPDTLEEKNQSINVLAINTSCSLDIDYDGYNPVNITAFILDQYGNPLSRGKVAFNLSGEIIELNVSNGFAKLTHIFEKGSNAISAEFIAIGYSNSLNRTTVYVDKHDVNMSANILVDLDNALVNLSLSKPINVTINIVSDIGNHTVKSVDGKASIQLKGLKIGLTNIKISLDDQFYESKDIASSINISQKRTSIVLSDFETVYKSAKEYKIKLIDEDGNPLIGRELEYALNNSTHAAVSDENGEVSLKINLAVGVYQFDIKFNGEKLFACSSNSSMITVKSSISLPANSYTYNSKYTVTFLNKDSNPLANQNVTIVFAGKAYSLKTDSKGKASINIYLSPGTYTVKIKNPNTSEEKTQTIRVLKRITGNKNLVMYYGAGSYYKVRVYDDNGKIAKNVNVVFAISGKKYVKKTNADGYAYIKINLWPKKYSITASYKGFTVKNNITVKPTVVTYNITRKKARIIKFNARLLNANGKILKYKYITFKFKNRKYKIKTNSKGIATLSIRNLYKGRYAIYSTYGNLTVKNTIKVI